MKAFLNFVLNLIYPKYCVSCRKIGNYLCKDCFDKTEYLIFPPKIKINKVPGGENPAFDEVCSLTYLSPPISQLIQTMKYKHVKDIARYLGEWLYLMLPIEKNILEKIDFITAVPMHGKRKKWRGFNQAEIIGKTLAKLYGKKYLPLLTKKAQTENQATVKNKKQRAENLKNVFVFNKKYLELVKNASVIIVDDVLTTGTTLNECARVLKESGVKKIVVVSFARQD